MRWRFSIGGGLALSGAVHALAIAAILAGGFEFGERKEAPPAIAIELAFAPTGEVQATSLPGGSTKAEPAAEPSIVPAQASEPPSRVLESAAIAPPAPKPEPRSEPARSEVAPPRPMAKPAQIPEDPAPPPELPQEMSSSVEPGTVPARETDEATSLAALAPAAGRGAAARASFAGGAQAARVAAGNKKPDYPRRARERGLEGRVVLSAIVTAEGRADRIEVKISSGHPSLDLAALDAVRLWRFLPAEQDGAPKAAEIEIPIVFRLLE